jgi:sugar phosphate permease
MSLYLQQLRGLSPLGAGVRFLPMMVIDHQGGTASGVFNTSRQVGGALAIAVFGALVGHGSFVHGLRMSLAIAAVVAVVVGLSSLALRTRDRSATRTHRPLLEGVA